MRGLDSTSSVTGCLSEGHDEVMRARCSYALTKKDVKDAIEVKGDYDVVLTACAGNVNLGPWREPGGLELEYCINIAADLLDPAVSTKLARMLLDMIRNHYKPDGAEKLLVFGLEMPAGLMIGQCAALCAVWYPKMISWCEFVYVSKTGTSLQLESVLSLRKPEQAFKCLAIDDVLSTGSSLRACARALKKEHNFDCVGAIYIVDRSTDRKTCPLDRLGTADERLCKTKIMALYDLDEVDKLVPHDAEAARIRRARRSFALPENLVTDAIPGDRKADYYSVLKACAKNVKMGPWTATSGIEVPYYLNAATNLLDKSVGSKIAKIILDLIEKNFKPDAGEKLVVYGMEMAGGVMAGQCATLCAVTHKHMLEWCDFVYVRKDRKRTGTCQQLEGPGFLTRRLRDSPACKCLAIDDALSLGGSFRDSAKLLKDEYNFDCVGAIYIVDRSKDRRTCPVEKLGAADASLRDMKIIAIYDLDQVDKLVSKADKVAPSKTPEGDAIILAARSSYALTKADVVNSITDGDAYDFVCKACAKSCLIGKGGGGTLALKAWPNLLDKFSTPVMTRMMLDMIVNRFKPNDEKLVKPNDEKLVVFGIGTGGVLAADCAAFCSVRYPEMGEWCGFACAPEGRRTTGDLHQFEGPAWLTARTKDSPACKCVAIGFDLSRGGHLRDSAKLMKEEFNCDCVGALFVVDRSKNRMESVCPAEEVATADDSLRGTNIIAIYDLKQIEAQIK